MAIFQGTSKFKSCALTGIFAVEILAQCAGGGWRTLSEWETLFGSQGFKLKDVKRVGCSMHLLVWQKRQ